MKSLAISCLFAMALFSQNAVLPEDSLLSPWQLVSGPINIPDSLLSKFNAISGITTVYANNNDLISMSIYDYGSEVAARAYLSILYAYLHNDITGYYPDSTMICGYDGIDTSMIYKIEGRYLINISTDSSSSNLEQARNIELIVIANIQSTSIRYFPNKFKHMKSEGVNSYFLLNGRIIPKRKSIFSIMKKNVIIAQ